MTSDNVPAAPAEANGTAWPVKKSEFQNHHMDSHIWNDFPFRSDDIVVATFAKSGTTWMQQILAQMIFEGDGSVAHASQLSPWVDLRAIPREDLMKGLEEQKNRRFMKTHLPIDSLVYKPEVKYIYVARDLRDVVWSAHHHVKIATPMWWAIINDTPGRVGEPYARPSDDPRDLLMDFIEDDTRPTVFWPYWSHIRGWWEARHMPNLLLVHFNDLKADLDGEMRRIAKFLDINPDTFPEGKWKDAVEHSTFNWMKEHADKVTPSLSDLVFEGGGRNFINKGTNKRWQEALSDEDNKLVEDKAKAELGEECARWMEHGREGRDAF